MAIANDKREGVILPTTLLILSILGVIAVVVPLIFVPRLSVYQQFRDWQNALYAGESAAERCLYIQNKPGSAQGTPNPQPVPTMVFSNGATYLWSAACGTPTPKTVGGSYKNSSLRVEIGAHNVAPP